jgi:hypothetical protein
VIVAREGKLIANIEGNEFTAQQLMAVGERRVVDEPYSLNKPPLAFAAWNLASLLGWEGDWQSSRTYTCRLAPDSSGSRSELSHRIAVRGGVRLTQRAPALNSNTVTL